MESEEIAREHQLILDLAKSNKRRIDNLEEEQKELRNLTHAVSQMVVEQKNMRDDLVEMKTDVKQIKEKPARRWDSMVEKALGLLTAAVVAWMLAQIGL
jgi:t-SNARE complex subunit (syntaxin)